MHNFTDNPIYVKYFWEHVDKNGPIPTDRPELGPCWLWTGSLNYKGYGRIAFKIPFIFAHVFSYQLHKRETTGDLKFEQHDHLCRVLRCCNPDHLEIVTRRENILRGGAPTAINARKTHCEKGHEMNGLRRNGPQAGTRYCLECNNERAKLHWHQKGKEKRRKARADNPKESQSISAINARKTHCPHGHPLDGERKNGTRYCKTCHSLYAAEWGRRKRQKLIGHSTLK
jgi:HNH endonuclease